MLFNRIRFQFSTNPLSRFGIQLQSIPPLPQIAFPVREYIPGEKQIAKQQIYDFLSYTTKQFPRCRYFVQEYQGTVYHVFDSSRYPFGKMMNKIATAVRGKNTPLYRNNVVNKGAVAIVVNAQDPLFTGKKLRSKELIYHTGFVGHLKREPYRDLMVRRPQLLYYYALNKCMPKNKLRKPCFQNLYVYRGKTHSFHFLPQFAPDKNIYEGLPEVNFVDMIKNSKDLKVVSESYPGLAKEVLGEKVEYQTEKEETPKFEMIPDISRANVLKLRARQAKLEDRYRRVGAIKKKKPEEDDTFMYFDSESKIKNSKYAHTLENKEEIDQDEEQIIKQVYGPPKQFDYTKQREDQAKGQSKGKGEKEGKGNPPDSKKK